MQYFADRPRPYWLVYATDLPWDAFPSFDQGGPATVAADDWGCSTSFPADHDSGTGHQVNGYRVPYTGERHWLDGAVFPTREQANRAQYEAGLTARFVYADTEWGALAAAAVQQANPDTTLPAYGALVVVRRSDGDLFAGRFVGWRPNGDAVVRTDCDAASGPRVPEARCCEGCESPFVPEPFADPEFCGSCTAEDADTAGPKVQA